MKSLRENCKLAVIKHGSSRTELPTTLAQEIETMEGNLKIVFSGTFYYYVDNYTGFLNIAWEDGEWQLSLNQETLCIRTGVDNCLGNQGGDIFLFPGRQVTISDFSIDLDERKVFFYGTCSTNKTLNRRQFRSIYGFSSNSSRMLISSEVFGETGHHKTHTRLFANVSLDLPDQDLLDSWSEGESDSSVDDQVDGSEQGESDSSVEDEFDEQLDPSSSGLSSELT
jgi:hypothetical protein